MWEAIFDWAEVVDQGSDVVAYFVMGAVGTLLFLIRLGLSLLFAGGDGDFDTDLDAGIGSDVSFTLFSLLSILAFFMGSGWMGLACRLDWQLGALPAAFIAAGTGLVMMLFASGLTYGARRLNRQVHYDVKTAVGRTGRVYLTIPEKGQGQGQVEVSVSGRRMILQATSSGAAIPAFAQVKVVAVRDDDSLVVAPAAE